MRIRLCVLSIASRGPMWHRHSCLCPLWPPLRVAIFNHAESRHRQECLCHIGPSILLRRPARSNRAPIDVEAGEEAPLTECNELEPLPSVASGARAPRRTESSMSRLTVVPSLAARSLSSSRSSSSIVIVVRMRIRIEQQQRCIEGAGLGNGA